jgi:hypothetical protein
MHLPGKLPCYLGRGRMKANMLIDIHHQTCVAGLARESLYGFRRLMQWKDRRIHLQ